MAEVKIIEVPEQGPPGITGPDGEPGVDGRTILYGGTAPSAAIGNDGDFYINTTTHYIYGPKDFGVWPAGTSLVGPQGPAGATGSTGATGPTGPTGLQGAQGGIRWNWSNSVTMADPGVGNLRFNNATLANVTAIAVDDQCAAPGNPDVSNFVLSWDDSNSGQKGYVVIQQSNDPATFLIFSITSITDNAGWSQLNGSVAGSAGAFTNGTTIGVIFTRTGDVGTASIPDGSLTLAKLVNATQGNFMTRVSAAGGPWEAVSIPSMSALTPVAGDLVLGVPAAGGAPRRINAELLAPLSILGLTPQGRLTLTTATPVLLSNVAGATTVRYVPHVGAYAPVWTGSLVNAINISGELTQTLSDATKSPAAALANKIYDIFLWMDGVTPRISRGPPWTSDSVRGTGAGTSELTRAGGGFLVNANAITNGPASTRGTYLGSVRTNASATIDYVINGVGAGGVEAKMTIWNAFNRARLRAWVQDSTGSYNQTVSGFKSVGNSAGNRISFLRGLDDDQTEIELTTRMQTGGSSFYINTIGIDQQSGIGAGSANSQDGLAEGSALSGVFGVNVSCRCHVNTLLGYHYAQASEQVSATTQVFLSAYMSFQALGAW